MQFRPCIDIHNGRVKQIVGSSLRDGTDFARENYVSEKDASFFAKLFQKNKIEGAHVILLNGRDSLYYEATKRQALEALAAYPGHLQIGGGITDENAGEYLNAGAAKVIVTSFVFCGGVVREDRLKLLSRAVGKERLVLDLSCRERGGVYYIVTDRWQNDTDVPVTEKNLHDFSGYCSEFLIHAVDVEGKRGGMEERLVRMLGGCDCAPITYAGGVHSFEDLETLYREGNGRLHVTIGSALDLYGGPMRFEEVLSWCRKTEEKTGL